MWFEANVERVKEVANKVNLPFGLCYTDGKNCFVWIDDDKIQKHNTAGKLMLHGNLRYLAFTFEIMSVEETGDVGLYQDEFGNFFAGVQIAGKVDLIELKVCHGAKTRNVFADFRFTQKWRVLMDDGTIVVVDYVGTAMMDNGDLVKFDENFAGAVRIASKQYSFAHI